MFKLDLEKAEETEIKLPNWIIKKARVVQNNIYFCFMDYAKAFDCVDHNQLWKILQEMGIPGNGTIATDWNWGRCLMYTILMATRKYEIMQLLMQIRWCMRMEVLLHTN